LLAKQFALSNELLAGFVAFALERCDLCRSLVKLGSQCLQPPQSPNADRHGHSDGGQADPP
jgi:hypothetical protein